MISEAIVPQLHQAGGEVVVSRWWKREGEAVRAGDVLCELETSKANTEIEATTTGVLRQILVRSGEAVPPLTVLALIGDPSEALPTIDPFYRTQRTGNQVPSSPPPPLRGPGGEGQPPRIVASPRAKKLAAEHGIDLATVTPSGSEGRIVEDDVRRVIDQASQAGRTRLEQAKTRQVEHAWQTIPHFYMSTTVDLTAVVAQKAAAGPGVTYTDFFAVALVAALRQVPKLNGHWGDGRLRVRSDINLGLVTQTDRGLVVPVLRHIEDLTLAAIASQRQRLVEQAHAGKLALDALADGTFSLSNIGPGSIDQFSAIIYAPQVAILSVGSVGPRPHVVNGVLEVRPTATFTLGVDHRAADGRDAAAFLERFKQALEG